MQKKRKAVTGKDPKPCLRFPQNRLQFPKGLHTDTEFIGFLLKLQVPDQDIALAAQIQEALRRIPGETHSHIALQKLQLICKQMNSPYGSYTICSMKPVIFISSLV